MENDQVENTSVETTTQRPLSPEARLTSFLANDPIVSGEPKEKEEPVEQEDSAIESEEDSQVENTSNEADPQPENVDVTQSETWESLEELADATGMSIDVFMKSIKYTDSNGEQIPLEELKNQRLMQADYTRKTQALASERAAFEAETTGLRNELQARVAQVDSVLQELKQSVLSEYESVNWNELREDDPTMFLMKQKEFEIKQNKINDLSQKALTEYNRLSTEYSHQVEQQKARVIEQQKELLFSKIPEWRDSSIAKQELSDLEQYLTSVGVNSSEFHEIVDHRMFVLARKAMAYDKLGTKSEILKKESKPVPKLVKSGTPKPKTEESDKRRSSLRGKLKTSGSLDDAAALLRHSIFKT